MYQEQTDLMWRTFSVAATPTWNSLPSDNRDTFKPTCSDSLNLRRLCIFRLLYYYYYYYYYYSYYYHCYYYLHYYAFRHQSGGIKPKCLNVYLSVPCL